MASYSGHLVSTSSVDRAFVPGRADEAYYLPFWTPHPLSLSVAIAGTWTSDSPVVVPPGNGYAGVLTYSATPGLDFYDRFHVLPRSISLGNILSTNLVSMETFSAYRTEQQYWTMFDGVTGLGMSLVGAPTLPVLVLPQGGFTFQLQVDLIGPAVVDTTLDFTFTDTGVISIPISFARIVLLANEPEQPFKETLEWLTDVLLHEDGSEQRRALRKNPRQFFQWDVLVEDGPERALLENILFEWQVRDFGIPVWRQATTLEGAITGGSTTTFTVGSTADRDFRVGSLVAVWKSATEYDVMTVDSFTATTITVTTAPLNSYTPAAFPVLVMPVRLGVITNMNNLQTSRERLGLDRLQMRIRVKDNDSDLADTSTWSAFNGKVLLDDFNFAVGGGAIRDAYQQQAVVVDGNTGLTYESSRQGRHRHVTAKGFVTKTLSERRRIVKLLHALRGQQVSFYLPTFLKDLQPLASITSGTATLAIQNVGYTNFVQNRQPRNVIRVVPVSGAGSPFIRTIIASVVDSATQETITVDSNWSTTLTPSQIDRISFVEESRLASDSVTIEHDRGSASRISLPVIAVTE